MERRSFKEVTIFRVAPEDKRVLEQVAGRLGLNESEVGRRAMRLGLKVLNKSDLPGSKIEVETA
jgi:hypothetical protein